MFYRFVNDSPDANSKMKKINFQGSPRLCLFATKEILEGEEIVYDYGVKDLPWRNKVPQMH